MDGAVDPTANGRTGLPAAAFKEEKASAFYAAAAGSTLARSAASIHLHDRRNGTPAFNNGPDLDRISLSLERADQLRAGAIGSKCIKGRPADVAVNDAIAVDRNDFDRILVGQIESASPMMVIPIWHRG
jgi:hypothetical protein